jgi:hypothetical protein
MLFVVIVNAMLDITLLTGVSERKLWQIPLSRSSAEHPNRVVGRARGSAGVYRASVGLWFNSVGTVGEVVLVKVAIIAWIGVVVFNVLVVFVLEVAGSFLEKINSSHQSKAESELEIPEWVSRPIEENKTRMRSYHSAGSLPQYPEFDGERWTERWGSRLN